MPHRQRRDVELVEIDGLVVRLKLNGACGSCPSSTTTMRMGIEKRLLEKIPEIMEVEQVTSEEAGLDLTEENVERPAARSAVPGGHRGGELALEAIEEPIVKIRLSGPAASVMTVRVAVTQKLREKMSATYRRGSLIDDSLLSFVESSHLCHTLPKTRLVYVSWKT